MRTVSGADQMRTDRFLTLILAFSLGLAHDQYTLCWATGSENHQPHHPSITQRKSAAPVRFAIAGFVDLDGDNKSDLARLIDLIYNGGDVVDAYVTPNGDVVGDLSSSTTFLLLGKRPDRIKAKRHLDAYTTLSTKAKELHLKSISLSPIICGVGLGRPGDPKIPPIPRRRIPTRDRVHQKRRGPYPRSAMAKLDSEDSLYGLHVFLVDLHFWRSRGLRRIIL